MISSTRACCWLFLVLMGGAGGSLATADIKLAPNQAINPGAKLVHPTISPRGDYLYWLNQSDGKLQRALLEGNRLDGHAVDVAAGARDFCLSPDGGTAYVAATANEYSPYRSEAEQRGVIQTINLQDMTVTGAFDVPIDPYEMVCDAAGFLYVTPGSGQWVKVYKIDPRRKTVLFGFGQIYGRSNLRLTPNRQRLYLATNGLSPGNISAVPIPADAKAGAAPYSSPYHGDHPLGGAFDITPDGKYAINRSGIVVRLGTAKGSDMLFVVALEANQAAACDPASSRLWLALADGRLLTYKYPGFELDKTESLASHGEALVYDAAHMTLWVGWATENGIGGLDAYNLQNSATYPNDITRARERPAGNATSAPPAAAPALVSAPAPVAAPVSVATAATPADSPRPAPSARKANLAAVHRDAVVLSLLSACAVLFLATLFFGRRTPTESLLRIPDADPNDPRNWPLPTSIKFIGWFGWVQVLSLVCVVWLLGPPGGEAEAIQLARILTAVAAVFGALSWGVLRGSKICFVAYALLLIAGLIATVTRGGSPAYVTVILLFIVIHFGRKHWDSLA